jgi:ABC-type enterobactin transport system permease subunit
MVPPTRHKYITCVTSIGIQLLLHVYTTIYTSDAQIEEAMHDGLWISYSIGAKHTNQAPSTNNWFQILVKPMQGC